MKLIAQGMGYMGDVFHVACRKTMMETVLITGKSQRAAAAEMRYE